MQEGAHQVSSAPGAQTLQHADLIKFRDYIRKKVHEDLPVGHGVEALDKARVELDEAKASSAKLHAENQSRRKFLAPVQEVTFDYWPPALRQAFESHYWQGPEDFEWDELKKTYLKMKEFLRDNRCPVAGECSCRRCQPASWIFLSPRRPWTLRALHWLGSCPWIRMSASLPCWTPPCPTTMVGSYLGRQMGTS